MTLIDLDKDLYEKIKKILKEKSEIKTQYRNIKGFVNNAVLEKIKDLEKKQ